MKLLADNGTESGLNARIIRGCVLSADSFPCVIRKPKGMSSIGLVSVAQIVDMADPSTPIESPPLAWSHGGDSTIRLHSMSNLTAGHSYRVDFALFGGAENGN